MAGHSKFHNIKHRKERQDQKKASTFEKLIREITSAIKAGGPDPKNNSRLKHALQKARAQNLPKDKIGNAIKLGKDKENPENFSELRIEGFPGGGTAVVIETLTVNKRRTVSEVKKIFKKFGGQLSDTGCVTHLFHHQGIIHFPISVATDEQMLEYGAQAGALDVISEHGIHYVYTTVPEFSKVLDFFSKHCGDPLEAHIGWVPKDYVFIRDKTTAKKFIELEESLEGLDDIQHVFGNYEITEDVYEALKNDS